MQQASTQGTQDATISNSLGAKDQKAQASQLDSTGKGTPVGISKIPCIAPAIPTKPEQPTPEPEDAVMRTELGTGVGSGIKRTEPENPILLDTETEFSDAKRTNRRDSETEPQSSGSEGKRGKKKKPNPSHAVQHNERQKEIEKKAKSLIEAATGRAKGSNEPQAISTKTASSSDSK